MIVSQITAQDIAEYIHVDDTSEYGQLNVLLDIAKNYISNYTGIPITAETGKESLDDYSDFVIVVYILCQDMHDNRALYVDGKALNRTVQTILDMHRRNLL